MGHGKGFGLLSAFLGWLAGLCEISGILVALGGLWASCSPRGGFVGWLEPVPESRSNKQGAAPKQGWVWEMLSLPSGWRWLMALGASWGQVSGWADSGCGRAGAPSTESHRVAAALTSLPCFMALCHPAPGPVQPCCCQDSPQERLFS